MYQFRQLLKLLTEHGVQFVVIGGVAATLRGSTLTTMDVDVCVSLDVENLRKIHASMKRVKARFRMRPDKMELWDDPERLVGFRNLNFVTEIGQIDLLGEVSGIGGYAEALAFSSPVEVEGVAMQVLELDPLIKSKRAAGRDKDKIGVMHLEAVKRKLAPPTAGPQPKDDLPPGGR